MKQLAVRLLNTIAPTIYQEIIATRHRVHSQKLEREWGCSDLARKMIAHVGPTVRSGPFEGLVFTENLLDRHISPKLVGSYEEELHPALAVILSNSYSCILDVGCAEGYYAVGFAKRFPNRTVYAFDTDRWARARVAELAKANGVANICVHGACTPAWLANNLMQGSFILSDCEGYEDILFGSKSIPALASCDFLVELHERPSPGVTERIRKRYASSHRYTIISGRPRTPLYEEDYPFLSEKQRSLAVREHRGDAQQWIFLEAGRPSSRG